MARYVCARCGAPTEVLIKGLCPKCFSKVYGVAYIERRIRVEACRYCGRIRLGGKWTPANSFREAVVKIVEYNSAKLKPIEPLDSVRVGDIIFLTEPDWSTRVYIRLEGKYRGASIIGGEEVLIQLKPSICPLCKVRVSGEYDTVVTIHKAPDDIESILHEIIYKEGIQDQLVDVIWVKDRLNVYFTNKGAASKLIKGLKKKFKVRVGRLEHEDVGITRMGKRRTRKSINIEVLE